jgi:hemerythrin-like metal-binding protein
MQPFEWDEKFSVHIPQMDAQHRQIIELLDAFRKCAQSSESRQLAPAAMEPLNQYAQRHLRREELVLRVRGYPEYAAHAAEHAVYLKKVALLQAQLERRDISIRITNFLTGWWKYHILHSDQEYARFFRGQAIAVTSTARPAA